jgi:predicted phosphodiesterase
MRLAVISDVHFGDDLCTLVATGPDGASRPGPAYPALRRVVGQVDYLILLGDILDFSVASYQEAYRAARAFFLQAQEDGLAHELVYVPGNHDFDIWHTVEHQVNVINQLKQGQLPRAFKRSLPAVLDDRPGSPLPGRLLLPDVRPRPEWHENRSPYGSLFLDHITRQWSGEGRRPAGRKLTVDFAYPNLYLVTREGSSVLLTHGHYFEAFWAAAAEWALLLAREDLPLEAGPEPSLRDLVGLNLPLNQLASAGIGQAHPLTRVARTIQREVTAGNLAAVARYLDRLEAAIQGPNGHRTPGRFLRGVALRWLKRRVLGVLRTTEQTRYSREFLRRPAVRERFRGYYRASLRELDRLRREHDLDLPPPTSVVFGHTHQPIPWGSDELVDSVDGRSVRFCNTGGFILKDEPDGTTRFLGAEVVLYETGRGVWSESIRTSDLETASPSPRAAATEPVDRPPSAPSTSGRGQRAALPTGRAARVGARGNRDSRSPAAGPARRSPLPRNGRP